MSHAEIKEVEYFNGHRIKVGGLFDLMERACRMGAPIDGECPCSECGHLRAGRGVTNRGHGYLASLLWAVSGEELEDSELELFRDDISEESTKIIVMEREK